MVTVERKSWRPGEFAKRHNLSPAFIYGEISAGRLRARKARAATLITEEDEQAWLDAMPVIEPSKIADAKSNESETTT
jgi:hypothetical protein